MLVLPPFLPSCPFPIPLGGPPGVGGAGNGSFPCFIPLDPVLIGLTVNLQSYMPDSAAQAGLALTQGVELVIG